MVQERSREWALDFIKKFLPEEIRNNTVLQGIDEPDTKTILDSFLRMREKFSHMDPELVVEFASLSVTYGQFLTMYMKMVDEMALRITALETFFGINGLDIEDLKKQKRREHLRVIGGKHE